MGGGAWSFNDYKAYSTSVGRTVNTRGFTTLAGLSTQAVFTNNTLNEALNPKGVIRECRDSDEHPNTIPIIIAADVTGSMGAAAKEVVSKLNVIITELYKKYKDIEICIMGIGDLAYDICPIQIGQFESDIRIAEQLDKICFEGGGGGNGFESYTAAWYYGLRHCDLDCWKRGKRGIIITTGDEPLNPYLPKNKLEKVSGDSLEADIETPELYKQVSEKYDIYHIAIDDKSTCYQWYKKDIEYSFEKILPKNHLKISTLDGLASKIVECINDAMSNNFINNEKGIAW